MRKISACTLLLALTLILDFSAAPAKALSLEELRADRSLTPQRFASYFSTFQFQFRPEVQTPDLFLSTRSGDCDDYSTLASMLLREKGYTPRLIAIRMPGMVHVICYVEETRSYLDYNMRHSSNGTVPCEPDLNAIARKVAKSFGQPWSTVSEFTFDAGLKRLVTTVSRKQTIAANLP
jgi:hypothetical protein